MKKILLLDIENIHKTEKELLQLLKIYTCVYLVYAKSPVALSLDALIQLSPFVMEKKLVVIKMPKIAPDAADFGLAFLAGQLSTQMEPQNTIFEVMSNDKKLEYIVDLLKVMGFKAFQNKIIPDFKTVIDKPKENLSLVMGRSTSHTLKLQHLMKIFLKLKNMPSTEKALLNGVKSWANVTTKDAEKLIEALVNFKIIKISPHGMALNKENLKRFLNTDITVEQDESINDPDEPEKILEVAEISSKFHLRQIKEYCDYLIRQQGKPSTILSLHNSIKSVLKLESDSLIKNRYKLLIRYGIVKSLDNGKVLYINENIKMWSNLELLSQQNDIDIPHFEFDEKESRTQLIQKIFYLFNELNLQKQVSSELDEKFYLAEI